MLRLPQQEIRNPKMRDEPLVDYSHSQVITSEQHRMGLAFVANKRAIALEEAAKKKEDSKLTKLKKAQEKKDKAVAKNLKGLLGASKKAFKKT
jgi:hypothetical protein